MRRLLVTIATIACGFAVAPPLIHGLFAPELSPAALNLYRKPRRLLPFTFYDGSGRSTTLRRFHGKFALLTVWATWCSPCTEEMASLDHLAALFHPKDLEVVPVSVDASGAPVVRSFYARLRLDSLRIFVDPSNDAMHALGVIGIPTTLLIDRDGLELGRVVGAARWDDPATIARISQIVSR
jgi:peroxiredoxin